MEINDKTDEYIEALEGKLKSQEAENKKLKDDIDLLKSQYKERDYQYLVAAEKLDKMIDEQKKEGSYGRLITTINNGDVIKVKYLLSIYKYSPAEIETVFGIVCEHYLPNENNDKTNILKIILKCDGADINTSALEGAAYNGKINTVKFLIKNGATTYKDEALQSAARSGRCEHGEAHVQFEIVKFLVENGANPESNHNYALRHAKTTEIENYLIDKL